MNSRREFLKSLGTALSGAIALPLFAKGEALGVRVEAPDKSLEARAEELYADLCAPELERHGELYALPTRKNGESSFPRVIGQVPIYDDNLGKVVRAPYVQISWNQFEVWSPAAVASGRLGYLFEDSKRGFPGPW